MVKVKSDRDLRILDNCSLNKLYKVCVVSISSCTLGNLKNNRALEFACCFCDSLGVCTDFRRIYDAFERFRVNFAFLVPALADILATKDRKSTTSELQSRI